MKKKLDFKNFSIYFDQYLFISITLLSVMGLFFLYSASQENITIVAKQAVFVGFGLHFGRFPPTDEKIHGPGQHDGSS